jgi:release factor glutamine methyltransferase
VKRDANIKIECDKTVYAPAEDSELLVGSVGDVCGKRVLDVGTGSGFAALHCAAAGATVTATDVNPRATQCAARNARANGLEVQFVRCDIASAVRGPYDCVLFNPPYLPGRLGQVAVDGGAGGIEVVSRLVADLPRLMADDGACIVVLSSHSDCKGLTKKFPRMRFAAQRDVRLSFETLTSYEIVMP